MITTATVIDFNDTTITIKPTDSALYILLKQQVETIEIRLNDGRRISADQRKRLYATMREISDYTGYDPDETKAIMKYDFIAKTGCEYFSLSDCTMTTAYGFQGHLMDFCVEWGVQCGEDFPQRAPDIVRYLYSCVMARRCAVCGGKADIHEYDVVGMGNNRKTIHHLGQRVQPLCRLHHSECHSTGQSEFDKKYIISWVKLDEQACDKLKWRK